MKAEQAASLIWPLLVETAREHSTIEYGQLAAQIGSRDRRLNWPLGVIQEFCSLDELPPPHDPGCKKERRETQQRLHRAGDGPG